MPLAKNLDLEYSEFKETAIPVFEEITVETKGEIVTLERDVRARLSHINEKIDQYKILLESVTA